MQEKLNSTPDDITEKSKNLDTLTEMSKSFDPEKAKQLVHQYSETHPDQNSDSHNYDNHSTVEQLSKKVEALTPQEASKEYLDILIDLSKSFTQSEESILKKSVLYSQGRLGPNGHYADDNVNVVKNLLDTATGKKYKEELRNNRTNELDLLDEYNPNYSFEKVKEKFKGFENPYLQKEFPIVLIDEILADKEAIESLNARRSIEKEHQESAELRQKKEAAIKKLNDMKHGRFNKIKEAFYKKFNPGGYLRTVNEAYNQDLRSSDQKIADSLNYRFDHALSSAYSVNLPKNPSEIADYIEDNKEAIRAERESQLFNEQNSDKINRAMEIRHKLIEDGLLPENPLLKDINKK